MEENALKRQLARVTAIVAVSGIALCAAIFGVLFYVFRTAHEAEHAQMKTEVEEYGNRIFKQLDKNLQILTTLSKVYEVSGIPDRSEELRDSIARAGQVNSFVSLAYFSADGNGILYTDGQEAWLTMTLDTCAEQAREAVEQSLQGENAVSRMFDSAVYDQKVFVYSVPVYRDGAVTGVLAASDTLEIFEDIVNGDTVMGGQGYIHLLGAEGDFLVRSENTLVKEDMSSIFDGPYLSEDTKAAARDALARQESMYGDFEYRGEKCHFYMEPLGLNGWYLFCANRLWDSVSSFGRIFIFVDGVFFFLLVMICILLYYQYYNFRKNSALLLRIAYFDPVTGAKNTARFDQEFQKIRKKQDCYSTVAFDIHNFKGINELFGRSRGDQVLNYIRQVMEENLREGEFFCRDTADRFYVLFLDTEEAELRERLGNIIQSVREITSRTEYGYEISIYAGVAIQGDREKALMALKSIQNTHQRDVAFYNEELHEALRRKNSIESNMQTALHNREFKLFLQPKMNLADDSLVGAEALVRWQKPDGSYRYPDEFIPLFEENGFCTKLDLYMVERVCEQIRFWMDAGLKPIPVSVNQSKLLFADRNYPNTLEQIVTRYGVPPALIILEMLESIAANDLEQINSQIEALHGKGFRVSMDDFGSGYSSLNMLYQIKIDELKLDRAFLRKASNHNDEERRQIILEQVIRFAKKLGITTVAEGVETQQDRDNMAALSCDYGQGYFYDRPITAEEFSDKYMFRPG